MPGNLLPGADGRHAFWLLGVTDEYLLASART
jgi:hypothetical protein